MTFARTALFLSTAVCAAQAQSPPVRPGAASLRATASPLLRGGRVPLGQLGLEQGVPPPIITNKAGQPINFEAPTRSIFRRQFAAEDYVFDLAGRFPTEEGEGGEVRGSGVGDVPALFGEGTSYTLFTIEPCGVNLPHVHPLGTEILYVISGEPRTRFLQTAHVENNNGRTLINEIGVGELVFFPEGLLHYQQNLGCEESMYISGLGFEDAGLSTITLALAELPRQGLEASLGQDARFVDELVREKPEGPAPGQQLCLQRCGLF